MVNEQSRIVQSKKKVRRTEREFNTAVLELRMGQLGIAGIADEYTVGMVLDLLTEQANDQEDYDIIATQDDIDAFLGRRV